MVRPSTEPRARQCDRTSFTAEEGRCTEARALVGPITITNLYASGGCTDELFIYAGHVANPHWIVSLLPTASLNLAGQLVVDDAEEVFIGTHAAIDAAPTGLRCTVVWSGVRPDPNE